MSKITFRAADDLVERLEEYDASKSEVMREALRTYLESAEPADGEPGRDVTAGSGSSTGENSETASGIDATIADRVDELIADRLDAALDDRLGRPATPDHGAYTPASGSDINVNVTLDGVRADESAVETDEDADRSTTTDERMTHGDESAERAQTDRKTCASCGDEMPEDHVYCPNCGEKRSHRVFCECGDEIRSDWAFCPGCGRRTPAADVLDNP
ncbi:zinc ribbon domain-containing protein [Halopenitus sp. POP-27]|uniref:double zinc ribbon domain-containing protein n=1 Tax=Halopenitus sp. POP-27 TaxID=2994425 RepID=UPI0024691DFD|nr:zinc ribbon domain-containing protein [Halopenitus sp. POP-27]